MFLRLCFIIITLAGLTFGIPCPFNTKECECEPDQRKPPIFDFEKVNCSSPSNYNPPTFTPANGTKLSVNTFRIYGNVAALPAYYFYPFSEIRYLELVDSQTYGYRQQTWNALAFIFCNFTALNVSNLDGMFPPPAALNELGSSGLQELSIGPVRNTATLMDYQFENFTSLRSLTLSGVPITGISENAFVGLEKHFTTLHLVNVSDSYHSFSPAILKAVAKLPGLTDLWLAGLEGGYPKVNLPSGYFSAFPKLKSLWLAYDTMGNTEGGYLYDLPPTLSSIGLTSAGLTAVPKLIFDKQQKHRLSLDLSSNAIAVIGPNDFRGNVVYSVVTIRDSTMSSIDLSFLPKDAKRIDLGNNKYNLKSVTASSLEEVPRYTQISINPALETIDPRLANSFVRYRRFSLDISNNQNMDCKNLVWITPYVFCWKTIRIQGSYCSTGQPVIDYLRNIGFNCSGN